MQTLITGATGFIGSAVAKSLLEAGHAVIGLVRSRDRGRALENLGVTLAVGEMLDTASYEPLVERVDAVIHLAQHRPTGRWTRRRIRRMHDSDAVMTRTLAKACLRREIPLVYTSGALARRGRGAEWIDESSPLRPCLLAKGHAQRTEELLALHRDRGLRTMIVSPGFVYGAGGFVAETAQLIARRQYRVIGSGENYWGLVHVDDLAELYVRVLHAGHAGEEYFACDDHPRTRRSVIDQVAACLGAPRVRGVSTCAAGLWLGFPLVEAITSSIRMRNRRAVDALGWRPRHRSCFESLPEVLASLESKGGAATRCASVTGELADVG